MELESYQYVNNRLYLEFTGYISKNIDNMAVKSVRTPDGRIERKIVSDGTSYERKTLKLTIEANLNGQLNSYSMCFLDASGNPDCGLGSYKGTLSIK